MGVTATVLVALKFIDERLGSFGEVLEVWIGVWVCVECCEEFGDVVED